MRIYVNSDLNNNNIYDNMLFIGKKILRLINHFLGISSDFLSTRKGVRLLLLTF